MQTKNKTEANKPKNKVWLESRHATSNSFGEEEKRKKKKMTSEDFQTSEVESKKGEKRICPC